MRTEVAIVYNPVCTEPRAAARKVLTKRCAWAFFAAICVSSCTVASRWFLSWTRARISRNRMGAKLARDCWSLSTNTRVRSFKLLRIPPAIPVPSSIGTRFRVLSTEEPRLARHRLSLAVDARTVHLDCFLCVDMRGVTALSRDSRGTRLATLVAP